MPSRPLENFCSSGDSICKSSSLSPRYFSLFLSSLINFFDLSPTPNVFRVWPIPAVERGSRVVVAAAWTGSQELISFFFFFSRASSRVSAAALLAFHAGVDDLLSAIYELDRPSCFYAHNNNSFTRETTKKKDEDRGAAATAAGQEQQPLRAAVASRRRSGGLRSKKIKKKSAGPSTDPITEETAAKRRRWHQAPPRFGFEPTTASALLLLRCHDETKREEE